MQRYLANLLLLAAGALTACVPALSTQGGDAATARTEARSAQEAKPALAEPRSPVPPKAEKPALVEQNKPVPGPEADKQSATPAAEIKLPAAGEPGSGTMPHLALLLPLKSAALGRAAEVARLGFAAAAEADPKFPLAVRVYPSTDDPTDIVAGYRSAVEAGAKVVAGPLTRSGVSAIVASGLVKVPTLALNVPEDNASLPPSLYVFSLQTEAETRQLAQLAAEEDRRQAVIVYADTPFAQRVRHAFSEQWRARGGFLAGEYAFSGDVAELPRLRQAVGSNPEQLVFLAMDASGARLVKPFLDPSLAVYATSQVNVGKVDPLVQFDLNGVRFVDMPWLLQPDHPAVMIYPRPNPSPGNELERLYALGIDAFRLARLIADTPHAGARLDGVTGQITLGADRYFSRELVSASFRQGEIVVDGAPQ